MPALYYAYALEPTTRKWVPIVNTWSQEDSLRDAITKWHQDNWSLTFQPLNEKVLGGWLLTKDGSRNAIPYIYAYKLLLTSKPDGKGASEEVDPSEEEHHEDEYHDTGQKDLILFSPELGRLTGVEYQQRSGQTFSNFPKYPKSLLVQLLTAAEGATGMKGLKNYGLATAIRESAFSNRAWNASSSEQTAARNLYKGARGRGFYSNKPATTDNGMEGWGFGSGGWFGFLPATGLSAGGTKSQFGQMHPRAVHDPAASVAMFVAMVQRLKRNKAFKALPASERTWAAIRRGWAANSWIPVYRESDMSARQKKAKANFLADAKRATGSSAWVSDPVPIAKPFKLDSLYSKLRSIQANSERTS